MLQTSNASPQSYPEKMGVKVNDLAVEKAGGISTQQ